MEDSKTLPLWLGVLVAIVWCILTLVSGKIALLGIYGWISFLFVPVFIVISYLPNLSFRSLRNNVDLNGIPLYYSGIFLAISIVLNGIYLLFGMKQISIIVLVANIVLLVAYMGLFTYMFRSRRALAYKTEKIREEAAYSSLISKKIGMAISYSSDDGIKEDLYKLKELIDYSPNCSVAESDEMRILDAVDVLIDQINNHEDNETIKSSISVVTSLWKARNTKL